VSLASSAKRHLITPTRCGLFVNLFYSSLPGEAVFKTFAS